MRHHHERVDGGGYPDGLPSEDIPLLSRIIAVADAYNAMTSDRPYREAMPSRVAAFAWLRLSRRNSIHPLWRRSRPCLLEPARITVSRGAPTSCSTPGRSKPKNQFPFWLTPPR